MAKNTTKTTNRNGSDAKIVGKATLRDRRTAADHGVVADTRGSRFKDAEVLAVVKRVLSERAEAGENGR